jgi:hypothetical protein
MVNEEVKYNKPQFEVVVINSVDIITTSQDNEFEFDIRVS